MSRRMSRREKLARLLGKLEEVSRKINELRDDEFLDFYSFRLDRPFAVKLRLRGSFTLRALVNVKRDKSGKLLEQVYTCSVFDPVVTLSFFEDSFRVRVEGRSKSGGLWDWESASREIYFSHISKYQPYMLKRFVEINAEIMGLAVEKLGELVERNREVARRAEEEVEKFIATMRMLF